MIRNITQLTAKNNGKPMAEDEKQKHSSAVVSLEASTTRVIVDETDKVAIPDRNSTTETNRETGAEGGNDSGSSRKEPEKVLTPTTSSQQLKGGDAGAVSREGASSQAAAAREVHTEVDKDNKKIEVVYAESVKVAAAQEEEPEKRTTTAAASVAAERRKKKNKQHLNDNVDTVSAAAATAQPRTSTLVQDDGSRTESGSADNEALESPPSPEVTTPLTPPQLRRREQQKKLLWRKELQQQQRNSLLTVLSATEIRTSENATIAATGGNVTAEAAAAAAAGLSSFSQRELARVADALKALRNLAALCNNKCNGSSINGVVSSKCLNRTTTGTFAAERKNRVENVLAKTHEEVAARTKAVASSRRLRKLRVCVRHSG